MFKLLQHVVLVLVASMLPVVALAQADVEHTTMSFSRIGTHNIELSVGLLTS